MGTDIYEIRVVSVHRSSGTVMLRVYLVYYDGGYTQLPTDPSFFLMMLRDGRLLKPNNTAASRERVYDSDQQSPLFQAVSFEVRMSFTLRTTSNISSNDESVHILLLLQTFDTLLLVSGT